MHREQRQRTRDLLKAHGIDRALFAHPESVAWLTGYAPPLDMGINHFAGGPALVWAEAGHFTLIVQDGLAAYAGAYDDEPDGTLLTYRAYTVDTPLDPVGTEAKALRALAETSGGLAPLAVEFDAVTARLLDAARAALPQNTPLIPCDGWLKPLRMIKSAEEIALIRGTCALTDVGHAAARAAVAPGIREIDLWMALQTAINRTAGHRVPLGNDCTAGTRAFNIGAWPGDVALRPGDSIIVDLSTRLGGYWSDSCMTYYADCPSETQAATHRFIQSALDYAISLVKPGAVAREIDTAVRAFIERGGYPVYPHHTGHSVGTGPHEEPRIAPYNSAVLEPGMIILLEPGTYWPGETGCRLEDALLVTADGCEILTHFDHHYPGQA
ncbi:MAG TPA: Xaa-Pro peptidase family protein [Candidatus Limnocylindrales bacterium]|nr:Xaa-Pro peptidase family protein [Candidatus Limnocylindrales bacterium]